MAAVQQSALFVLLLFAVAKGENAKGSGGNERRFEELERRLNDHETAIEGLQNTVATQQSTLLDQQTTIQDQQVMIQDLQATIKDQQTMVQGQNRLIQQIQTELRTGQESRKKHSMLLQVIQRDIRNVRKMFEDPTTTDDGVKAEEKETGDDNRIRESDPEIKLLTRRQDRSSIAFSAYLDHDMETANHQTVKFNQIITNEGNGYNTNTGVFTCSVPGMYLLIFNVGERDAGKGAYVRLNLNSVDILDAVVDTYHNTQDLQGGNSVLLRLKAGDSVWIAGDRGGHAEGSSVLRLTTFSGVFLYP